MPSRSPQEKNLLQLHTNPSAALSPPITETNTPHSVTYTWANLPARRKTVLKSEEDIFLSLCPFLNAWSLVLNYNDAMSGGHNNKWPNRQKWKMKGKPGHQFFRSFWENQRKVSPRGPCFTAQKWGKSKSDIIFPTQHFLGVGYGNQMLKSEGQTQWPTVCRETIESQGELVGALWPVCGSGSSESFLDSQII